MDNLNGAATGGPNLVVIGDKSYLASFPFLALPWEGERQGHGKPAP